MSRVVSMQRALTWSSFTALGLLLIGIIASYSSASIGVSATISVGPNPTDMVLDSVDNSVFVIVRGNGGGTASVTDIDAISNAVITTQKVTEPVDIAYNPTNDKVYVTSENHGVNIISGSTGKLIKEIDVDTNDFHEDVAFDPSNGNAYVADTNPGEVSVISGPKNTLVSTIKTGGFPQHIAYDPADGNMYVFVSTKSSSISPYVSIVNSNTNKIESKISLALGSGSYPEASFLYNPSNEAMLLSDGSGAIFVITNGALVATISETVTGMAFSPSNEEVYAVGSNVVYAIDSSNSIVATISTPGTYVNLVYDQVNNDVYVGGSTVNVINTENSVVTSVDTGSSGYVIFNPAGGNVYASLQTVPGSIDVISSS
jgi:DNA-binding beta-propeller fold protein YncE